MKTIYLDNNATTAVAPEVREMMRPYFEEMYFNPSSMYDPAREPAHAVQRARETVARGLGGVEPDEILFTSCATESNNTAIFGAMQAHATRRHMITSAVEHPAVLEVCREAERRGCELDVIPVDRDGRLDMNAYVKALRRDTLLVSIMAANNETGVVFPVGNLARIAKETDPHIIFHTDATQVIAKMPVDVPNDWPHVDMLSFSGHKMHAPKGVGALYIKRGVRCRPYLIGGHQERGRRAGTENVAFIAALGRAMELGMETLPDEERVRALRDKLQAGITGLISHVEVNGGGAERLPNTLNIAVHGIEGESILYELNSEGICASSGSACTSGSLDPSHVLKAMNVPFSAIHGSVRFSLSRYTTEEEIDRVIEVFPGIVRNLRRLSPYWNDKENRPDVPGMG